MKISVKKQQAAPQGHFFAGAQGTRALCRKEPSVNVVLEALPLKGVKS